MQISVSYGPLMFINYLSFYFRTNNYNTRPINKSCYIVRFSQLNIFTVHRLYWPSFVYWTFVYDTYAFRAEQTRWPSMTRSKEFSITPVWMIVRFLQVNSIEKITKLDQKAVRYSVLTGYGLFRVFSTKNNKEKIRDHIYRSVSAGVRFCQGTV